MGYLTNFIVYTMAMVGVMMFAVFVFKKATGTGSKSSTKYLKVIDTMSIAPRKMLYIIAAGNEKFLIAGDVDKTTLISKLNTQSTPNTEISAIATSENQDFSTKSFQEYMQPEKKYTDSGIVNTKRVSPVAKENKYNSVIKNLAQKMSQYGIEKE